MCLLQVGDVEGAGKVLQMMKTAGIKVNENIFNSLIMGHGESGDLARAHGMLKVRIWYSSETRIWRMVMLMKI